MGREPLRVLIVDDDRDHACLMAIALEEGLGAATHCCASSREALEQIEETAPEAVVLDYRLPDTDGWEALRAIRRQVDVPVIVVTGEGGESAAVEALKAGAEDYLLKEEAYLRSLPAVVLRAAENHRRRREGLAQLNKTSRALAGSLELEAVVAAALDGVMGLLRPDAAWLLLPDGDGGLELVGARNLSPESGPDPKRMFRSHASAPVAVKRGKKPGFLCAGANAPDLFGPQHQELLGTIASHTASAVANAQLFASLSRAKAQWERTFDSISDPILIIDDRFRVMRLNRAAARCMKVPIREAVGGVCHRLLLGSEQPCPWHDALVRGAAVSTDRYVDHLERWFSFSAFPFEDEGGERTGVVHVLRDITEERKLRQQVSQAQKLAAIGELVAGVAHELNNPLTGILGFSQLLLRGQREFPFRDDLEKIANEARRAARIVRNLCAFARQKSLSRRLVDVNEVLKKIIELRGYQLRAGGTSVTAELAPDLPRILADPDELQQVFLNIVNNAEQAMAGQQSARRIVVRSEQPSPGVVRIEFRDTGPGIPEGAMDRIFDPFFTTREAGGGTGLGLSVCYGIVRGHGGQIAAAKAPEGGAVFSVELPVRDGSVIRPTEQGDGEAGPPAARGQILVVDDEPVVAEFVQRALVEEGHGVDLASHGEAALAKILEGKYDVVVCDLKLPDMSGPELYERVRAAAPQMAERFIFCTGDTLGAESRDFLRARPGPWLEKPLMLEDIKRIVNNHLAARMSPDE